MSLYSSNSSPAEPPVAVELRIEAEPDPLEVEFLEAQIRRAASEAMGLGDEVELAIFVRDAGRVVAGVSGWTWGDSCELQNLWVEPARRGHGLATRLLAAAEHEAAARGCTQTFHSTYGFQARELYEKTGYELVGRVEDFPSGTEVLWYRKRLSPPPAQGWSRGTFSPAPLPRTAGSMEPWGRKKGASVEGPGDDGCSPSHPGPGC